MQILSAKEAGELLKRCNISRAKRHEEKLMSMFPIVMEDINMAIRNTAINGFSEAHVEVSKYIGFYWIGIIKEYLQLLGYTCKYYGSSEEFIISWKG